MQRCQRLQILLLGPTPGPDPDPSPDHTLGAAPAQDPENVAIGKSNDLTYSGSDLHPLLFMCVCLGL